MEAFVKFGAKTGLMQMICLFKFANFFSALSGADLWDLSDISRCAPEHRLISRDLCQSNKSVLNNFENRKIFQNVLDEIIQLSDMLSKQNSDCIFVVNW